MSQTLPKYLQGLLAHLRGEMATWARDAGDMRKRDERWEVVIEEMKASVTAHEGQRSVDRAEVKEKLGGAAAARLLDISHATIYREVDRAQDRSAP